MVVIPLGDGRPRCRGFAETAPVVTDLGTGAVFTSYICTAMPFILEAYIDDCKLTATAQTAKMAFAEAIEWHVAMQLAGVTIGDGIRSYSIAEFAEVMALREIADTR